MFPDVIVNVVSVIVRKSYTYQNNQIDIAIDGIDENAAYQIPQKRWEGSEDNPFNIFERPEITELADKLREFPELGERYKITLGSKPFQLGKGEPPQTDEIVDEKPYVSNEKKSDGFRPLLRGSQIRRYLKRWEGDYWIDFGDHLAEPRRSAKYDADSKIVIRRTDDSLMATIDKEQFVITNSGYTLVPTGEDTDIEYMLALLNSQLLTWFYQNILNPEVGEALAEIKRKYLTQLPIPSVEASKQDTRTSLNSLATEMINLKQQRSGFNLSLPDYLGNYESGPTLGEFYQPPAGLADSIFNETTEDRDKLKLGSVTVAEEGSKLVVRATARYKPENPEEFETGPHGYTETEPLPAMEFLDLSETERALVQAFVPYAVAEAQSRGTKFAGFKKDAGKNIPLIKRLKDLTLPVLDDVEGGLKRYQRTKERAEELDEKIEKTDELIDQIVYRLYGLTDEEIEIVEEAVGD